MKNTHNVTCAACFNVHAGSATVPARHGFEAHNVRHGESGGCHTGECFGTSYPHLGISTDGTLEAKRRITVAIGHCDERLAELAERPALVWTWQPGRHESRKGAVPKLYHVEPGARSKMVGRDEVEDCSYSFDVPAYDDLHRRQVWQVEARRTGLIEALAVVDGVLADWSPEKYAAVPREAKKATVHLEGAWGKDRSDRTRVARCQAWAFNPSFSVRLTTDPAAVTCTRCRKQLEA